MKLTLSPLSEIQNRNCSDVTVFPLDSTIIDGMFKIMKENNGIGLAAPQIGVFERFFIVSLKKSQRLVVVNPFMTGKISKKNNIFTTAYEGCLTVPNTKVPVKRFINITLKGVNENREPFVWHCTGLLARVIQHEYDHLQGYCII